jgi:hypothetical protein
MAISFDTTEYRSSHGAEPRGRGGWAFVFRLDGQSLRDYTNEEIWWSPGALTLTEAKKLARAEAQRRFPGQPVNVGVCP